MFWLKNKIIIVLMLFISGVLGSSTPSEAKRTATTYALCITKSPFNNFFFLQLFFIESTGNAPMLETSIRIPLDKQTLEPVLNKDQYKVTVRRFLLETNRRRQITSSEPNVPNSPYFSFQGELKKSPDSAFALRYKYEENNAGMCHNLGGILQVEPDKIQIIGGYLREETPIPVTARKTPQKTTGESTEK